MAHTHSVQYTKAEYAKARKAYCRATLLEMVKPGATVYTILRHCSASGMTRRISLAIVHEGKFRCIDVLAADLMGDKVHRQGGIVVGGCGMDMGYHLVYQLGACLWPSGTPEPDHCGGYELRHEWV